MPQPRLSHDPMPAACFAPAFSDEKLAAYQALWTRLPAGELGDAMGECLAAVHAWWDLPESEGTPDDQTLMIRHKGKQTRVKLTGLTRELQSKLWDVVPWPYELDATQALFDREFADRSKHPRELCDACYHLLWLCRELCCDREPLTQDRLA